MRVQQRGRLYNLCRRWCQQSWLSHGKNWALSSSLDETENTNADATLVDRVYSSNDTAAFDDLVVWVAPNILKSKMLSAGFVFGDNN